MTYQTTKLYSIETLLPQKQIKFGLKTNNLTVQNFALGYTYFLTATNTYFYL